MFRIWGKIFKDNHLVRDMVYENGDTDINRTKKYLPVFTHLLKPLICNSQFGLTKTLMNSSGLTKPALNKITSSSKSTSTTSKSK